MVQRLLWLLLTVSSPIVAHWITYQRNPYLTYEVGFLALWDKLVMKCLPYEFMTNSEGCKMKTIALHLLQRLSHEPVQLQTYSIPWKELTPKKIPGWSTLCFGKIGPLDVYLRENFNKLRFLHLPIHRHTLKSLTEISILRAQQ